VYADIGPYDEICLRFGRAFEACGEVNAAEADAFDGDAALVSGILGPLYVWETVGPVLVARRCFPWKGIGGG
jgi:hypothetical protein